MRARTAGWRRSTPAAAAALVLFRPWRPDGGDAVAAWLPYAAVSFPALGAWWFFARHRPSRPVWPAMGFIVFFYLALIVQALAIGKALSDRLVNVDNRTVRKALGLGEIHA
jgi:hypothetical protein